ncbi:hypothetical protein B0H14DRAFT_3138334 [Mycena olivaceomarginata]|nr:hypothetical protein B0H14DRAFT_3138334 [Mycena olivaceomarginata]
MSRVRTSRLARKTRVVRVGGVELRMEKNSHRMTLEARRMVVEEGRGWTVAEVRFEREECATATAKRQAEGQWDTACAAKPILHENGIDTIPIPQANPERSLQPWVCTRPKSIGANLASGRAPSIGRQDMENGIDDAVQRLLNAYLLLQQPTLSLWLQSGTESSSRIGSICSSCDPISAKRMRRRMFSRFTAVGDAFRRD